MRKISRRTFVSAAAASAAALTFPIRRVAGANESIHLAFVGVGGRGGEHTKWFSQVDGVRVHSLCDPDQSRTGALKAKFTEAVTQTDVRKILDDKSVDAVVIASCNHWHALSAIWAMQAGKDVYVEKPVSNNVWEGRKIVEASRKYNRICQGGTQQRSDPVQAEVRGLIKSGELGKMLWIRGNRLGLRQTIGKRTTPLQPPAGLDYDQWLGPAQDEPIFREKFHYDWHWMWNTGSGEMGNWGVHILDDIRNVLSDQCTLPKRILSGGGRFVWNDAGDTPNAHFVYFDTGVVPVVFALSNLPRKTGDKGSPNFRNIQSGYVIQFENGYYAGGRGGGKSFDKDGKMIKAYKGDGGGKHATNFIEACRKRDRKMQNAEIEQTHYSSAWCHLANVAQRLGAQYARGNAEAIAPDFAPHKELVQWFEDHMKANDANIADVGCKASTVLEIDPEKETFIGPSATPQALALLKREYRKPYVVPDQV